MKKLVDDVAAAVESGEQLVMATIVKSSGSTPRSSGAKMAIRSDGSILGTVGGGLVEATACTEGLAMHRSGTSSARLIPMNLTQELAAGTDMICGGELVLLLEPVHTGSNSAVTTVNLRTLMRNGDQAVLLSLYKKSDNAPTLEAEASVIEPRRQVLLAPQSPLPDDQPMDKEQLAALLQTVRKTDIPELLELPDNTLLLAEPFTPAPPLYLFGAGHVSQATSRVAASVGFRIIAVDDRDDFANRERFPEADQIVVAESLDSCMSDLNVGEDAFIAILTRGHLHDKTVLAQSLQTPAHYIGMIGSTKKRNQVYDALLAEGFTTADIERCHCPIGLSIGGRTPEEIAVSIVAELISVRSGFAATAGAKK